MRYNNKVAAESGGERDTARGNELMLKKVKRNFEKGIDKGKALWYNR